MHNSKGLEFNRVIIAGVGEGCSEDDQATEVRLLYIAMTRAMQNLLITSCKAGYFRSSWRRWRDGCWELVEVIPKYG